MAKPSGPGDAESDLLGIVALHPTGERAVRQFLADAGLDEVFVKRLAIEASRKKSNSRADGFLFAGCLKTANRITLSSDPSDTGYFGSFAPKYSVMP